MVNWWFRFLMSRTGYTYTYWFELWTLNIHTLFYFCSNKIKRNSTLYLRQNWKHLQRLMFHTVTFAVFNSNNEIEHLPIRYLFWTKRKVFWDQYFFCSKQEICDHNTWYTYLSKTGKHGRYLNYYPWITVCFFVMNLWLIKGDGVSQKIKAFLTFPAYF